MNLKNTVDFIKSKIDFQPEIGIILGSGLGSFGNSIENKIVLEYKDIVDFPVSTVVGHEGKLIFGNIGDKKVVAMQGRIHYYEGNSIDVTCYPTRVICSLGIKNLIVTNAAGGVNKEFNPADLMLINDHINFTGINPLVGKNDDEVGPRFPDMTYAYSRKLMEVAREASKNLDIDLKEGVYIWFTGPSYETPAEIKMARILGADAVGMSTVPEVICARHMGVEVLGISCITNMAAGILDEPLNHSDVMAVSNKITEKFTNLLTEIVCRI